MMMARSAYWWTAAAAVALTIWMPALAATPPPGAAATALSATADPAKGKPDDLFGLTSVHTIHLTIAPADFARMPPPSGRGGRGLMGGFRPDADDFGFPKVPARLEFDDAPWGMIEVRYKGNSSYRSAPNELKRSLKLDFERSAPGSSFFGLSKLNLNNNAFDSSQMREALSYDVFTRAGVPAPKTAYVRVFVTVPGQYDHEYAGLFTAIEEIDQTFFKDRWGKKVGLLVKPEGLRGMPYLEGDWASYERPYGAKAGSTAGGQSRFIAFVKFLNEAPDKEFEQHIGEYLDVDEFLRFLAGEVVLVNTDSPLAMNHNYFVTIHPTTNKVTWVPWDMNMSFGGFMTGDENLSIHQPSGRGMFPLADRMLANKTLRARYDAILREMVTRNVTVSRLVGEMERIAPTIRPAVAKDESVSLGSFERNLLADLTLSPESNGSMIFGRGRNGPPLRVFLTARVESVLAQLDGKSEGTPGRGGRGGFGPPPSRGRGFTVR